MVHTIGGLAPVGVGLALAWILVGLAELLDSSGRRLVCYVVAATAIPVGVAVQFANYRHVFTAALLPFAIASVLFIAGASALLLRTYATPAARQRAAAFPLGQRLSRRVAPFILMGGVVLLATAVLSLPLTAQTRTLLNGAVVVGFLLASLGIATRGA